jgi:nucleoside-diphosphate-sugar epimerase
MKMLVAGASGLVGYAAVKHFASLGWEVVGISRRIREQVEGATFVSVDLTNAEECRRVFGEMQDITHVVYAALRDGAHRIASERDYTEGNLSMLRNFLEPLEKASTGLEHVSVVHGTRAYGMHLAGRAICPRLRESDPRVEHPSFYFLQEDYLRERQLGKKWAWTVWRPTAIFGEAVGNSMNAIPALGVYGALLREEGEPLHFPGNPEWRVVREACDSELLAKAFSWAATNPTCRNEIYNVSNGDQFEWQDVWPTIAQSLGMEAGDPRPMCLGEEIPRRRQDWAEIVAKHDLKSSPDPMEFGGSSFAFLDLQDGYYQKQALRIQLSSTIKIRQHGFAECIDTEDMFRKWFARMQTNRLLPMPDK